MKMHDVSYEYESYGCGQPACPTSTANKKTRKEYPCLYIRGKAIPKMEVDDEGFGTATIKFRILGYREPSEGEKTLELEVHEIGSEGASMESTSKKEKEDESTDELDATFDKIAKKDQGEDDDEE
jgi:hypothetical protein